MATHLGVHFCCVTPERDVADLIGFVYIEVFFYYNHSMVLFCRHIWASSSTGRGFYHTDRLKKPRVHDVLFSHEPLWGSERLRPFFFRHLNGWWGELYEVPNIHELPVAPLQSCTLSYVMYAFWKWHMNGFKAAVRLRWIYFIIYIWTQRSSDAGSLKAELYFTWNRFQMKWSFLSVSTQ